jgi:translation initiation factor 1 (eIF-1/SUI1)
MTSSTRVERVDLSRLAAQFDHRVAHGGKVHDGRHAGEVLQQHAGRDDGQAM